jgi:BlaI family transcriptional regulator, penicillinase repressor
MRYILSNGHHPQRHPSWTIRVEAARRSRYDAPKCRLHSAGGVMNSPQPAPTERELQILKILWDIGPATVRQVWDVLREREDLAQNTVQTFLRLMETKGLVSHRVEGRGFLYTSRYTQQRTLSRFLKKVFGGSADQLVKSLLSAKQLSPSELKAIDDLIQQEKSKRGL